MLINIMTACGGTVGLLLAFHLFSIKRNVPAVFLGLYVLFLSMLLLEPLLIDWSIPNKILDTALAISTLAIGPALYLYCRARVSNTFNAFKSVFHFVPAAVLAFSIALSPEGPAAPGNTNEEVALYFLFNFQVFIYLILSMKGVAGKAKAFHFNDRIPLIFVRLLTYGSFLLFSYSLLNTILHTNQGSGFLISVQVLLNLLLIIIALLNTEGLERRPNNEWIDDQFPSHKI